LPAKYKYKGGSGRLEIWKSLEILGDASYIKYVYLLPEHTSNASCSEFIFIPLNNLNKNMLAARILMKQIGSILHNG
jgi:hypothetical protein